MFSREFVRDTLERALSTFAQATLAALPLAGASITATTTLAAFWPVLLAALGTGLIAAVLSVLKCIAAGRKGNKDSASLVDASIVQKRGKHDLPEV